VITGTPTTSRKNVDHVLGPAETGYVTVDDDAIEAMVDERQQVAEQLGE